MRRSIGTNKFDWHQAKVAGKHTMTNNSYQNKIALVTGASRGIGRANTLALANAGARVIIHYGRSAAEANRLCEQIRDDGGQADIVSADLAAPDGAAGLAEQVRELAGEKLDILAANAGISKAAAIEEHTVEDFDNLFATNVRAPFFLVQKLLPSQKPKRIPILAIDARLCLFHPRADGARVPPERRTELSECRQSGGVFDHGFTHTLLAKHTSFSGSLVAEVSSLCISSACLITLDFPQPNRETARCEQSRKR
jgi:NAD(P)-dependent dehydrogenase (short-subunit alcohol dehydrogenase family)